MTLVRMTTSRRRRWSRWRRIKTSFLMTPSTLHVHHHDGSTAMASRGTKSFHAFHVNQIGKVWEATLIVALINSSVEVMMILL
jgi:hypothetical protein